MEKGLQNISMDISINDGLRPSNFILLTKCLYSNVFIVHCHLETYGTNRIPVKSIVSFVSFAAVIQCMSSMLLGG